MNRKALTLVLALAVVSILSAQTAGTDQQKFQPTVGQPGKDVIWVPTSEELVKAMLDMADVTPNDFVVDLGSGDGRIAIAAAKRGAKAMGVEFNPDMVALSREAAVKEGVAGKVTFVQGDIFETDFSKATVVTMYLLSSLNMKLRPTILEMKPGTRVVSHAFSMEDWEPDQTHEADYQVAYLWIVPAKVAGSWTWKTDKGTAELRLSQTFQKIEGTLKMGGTEMALMDAKLKGDKISFAVDGSGSTDIEFSGTVSGETIVGTSKSGADAAAKWIATRQK